MTGKIFKEYLLWFDGKMAGRQIILLMMGFQHITLDLTYSKKNFYKTCLIQRLSLFQLILLQYVSAWTKASSRHGKRNTERSGYAFCAASTEKTRTL